MENFENNNNLPSGTQSSVPAFQQPPVQNTEQPPAAMPLLQLTPEQIATLLNQLVIVQPPQEKQIEKEEVHYLEEKSKEKKENNPGTRILFQSDDFDEKEKSDASSSLPDIIDEESSKADFYDDSALFLKESPSLNSKTKKNPSLIKTTDFGSDFSIDEVELLKDDMPKMKYQKSKEKKALPEEEKPQPTVEIEEETFTLKKKSNVSSQKKNVITPTPISASIVETETEIPMEILPKKKKLPLSEIIRRSVLGVALAVIVISAAVLLREFKLHRENQNLESEISNLIVSEAETTKKNKKDNKTDKNESETTALSAEMQWAQIKEEYPNVLFPPNLQLKYAKLYATNQDFVGYLSADGIGMNLPIVQTSDDEKYLTKNFYGQTTKYGCPFVTHLNNISELDMNTVIFGHHMNDGTVFGILDEYKSIENYKKAPVITFNTLYNDYQWKIIAAFVTNAYEKDDNGYVFQYYFTSLSTEERFSAYLNELSQRSLYDTGVDVLPSDKLLTLSTCSHEFTDARFVVVARLVRPGESATVDTDAAVLNTSPRYPQAYYNKTKTENPYKNAQKWYVG